MSDELSTSLYELGLSVRTSNCLRYYGLKTVGDVVSRGPDELLRMDNFGRKSLNELAEVLHTLGIQFAKTHRRKYLSFRVDLDVYQKLEMISRASGHVIEAEIERIVKDGLEHIPSAHDIVTRLDRLEQAVFGEKA